MRRLAACALLLAGLSACASTPVPAPPLLPFHVALIPVQTVRRSGGASDERRIELESRRASQLLRDALQERGGFTAVTLLPDPAEGLNPAALDAHWVAEARAVRADLLMECRLEYQSNYEGERNEKFWLNLPLFLFGGPACYWVNDRTYRADAELTGDLYDLSLVYRELYPLGSARVRLLSIAATFGEATMDFTDRADRVDQYAISLIWPAGLLARSNDRVRERLEEMILRQLSTEFASRVAMRRRDVVEPDGLVNFWFEPAPDNATAREASAERTPWVDLDSREVKGRVVLRIDEDVRRMTRWRIGSPATLDSAPWNDFPSTPPPPHVATVRGREQLVIEYTLRHPIAHGDTVCLELEDGHENRFTRTYTIPITGGRATEAGYGESASDGGAGGRSPTRSRPRRTTP